MLISSGQNLEVSAKQDLDLYGKQKFIGYTDGKAEIGAKERMLLFGTNSLITAKDKIEYKAPKMNKLPQKGEFKYDKEKQILSVKWMNAEMDNKITNAFYNEKLSLLLRTRNYEEGETITIVVNEADGQDINEQGKEITLTGVVDKNGFAELRQEVEVLQETQAEKEIALQKQQAETDRKNTEIYKTYQGKDYTYNEWKAYEQQEWEKYQQNKKLK